MIGGGHQQVVTAEGDHIESVIPPVDGLKERIKCVSWSRIVEAERVRGGGGAGILD